MGSRLAAWSAAITLSLILAACGPIGSGTDTSILGTASAGAGTTLVRHAFASLSVGLDGLASTKPAAAAFRSASLRKSAASLRKAAVTSRSASTPILGLCSGVGTAELEVDPDTSETSIVYNDCILDAGDVDITLNLTLKLTPLPGAIPDPVCGYDGYTFLLHGARIVVGAGVNETTTFNQYTMNMVFSNQDPVTCEPGSLEMDASGLLSVQDTLNSRNSFSMTVQNLSARVTATTAGDQVSLDGTVKLEADCFSGLLTIDTPMDLFIPTDEDCPTGGEVSVTGAVSGTSTFTATGGVIVDDGETSTPYNSCRFVTACQ